MTTEQTKNILQRLNILQKTIKAKKDKTNAFGKYKYRDAESILEAIKIELNEDECILCDSEIKLIGDRFYVEILATFKTPDGEITRKAQAREDEKKAGMDMAQLTGACISYAKKYALCNLFAIDNGEDDPDSKENTGANPIKSKPKKEVFDLEVFDSIKEQLLKEGITLNELVSLTEKYNTAKLNFAEAEQVELQNIIKCQFSEFKEEIIHRINSYVNKSDLDAYAKTLSCFRNIADPETWEAIASEYKNKKSNI